MKTNRTDYLPIPVSVPTVDLSFLIEGDSVIVRNHSKLVLRQNSGEFFQAHNATPKDILCEKGIQLHGSSYLEILEISINHSKLGKEEYVLENDCLKLNPSLFSRSPMDVDTWDIETCVKIVPRNNNTLSGLYTSNGIVVTQCEAEGFRNITFSYDRPDILSVYTTTIIADASLFPVLLSNGNLRASGVYDEKPGFHFVEWHDPFPKPTYLFGLVAGRLSKVEDKYSTVGGKEVLLHFYSEEKYIKKLDHAMISLKKAMKWDEKVFGLEYDLEIFNVIAIDDFNAGAMENKSLNIYNSSLIVADKRTTTDIDFERIEGVVAHEYFHNWTGNRVTLRDWFQLTLKEGLTVYRDQEFSADMNSRAVVRLQNVSFLRSRQFPEDQSSMKHPIRPEEYESIDNFYTYTVYEKGAEVVRMYETLYGTDGFRKGMDLYFQRHDRSAVTCEDFFNAMTDANNDDSKQLFRWYNTAGTPKITITTKYDYERDLCFLFAEQTHEEQQSIPPLLVPIRLAFFHRSTGKVLKIQHFYSINGHHEFFDVRDWKSHLVQGEETVIRLSENTQTFVFPGLHTQDENRSKPVLSAFRGFSAPVVINIPDRSLSETSFLLKHDTDEVNRYLAGQSLTRSICISLYRKAAHLFRSAKGEYAEYNLDDSVCGLEALDTLLEGEDSCDLFKNHIVKGFEAILNDPTIDGKFKAHTVSLPALTELSTEFSNCDPILLYTVHDYLNKKLARSLEPSLFRIIKAENADHEHASADRAIKNKAYSMLALLKDPDIESRLLQRMRDATNMTDELASLNALNYDCSTRVTAMREFHEKWKTDALVMHKWYLINASSNIPSNLVCIEKLFRSEQFVKTNPNNIYSLLGGLKNSYVNFHSPDYQGYSYLVGKVIEMDQINPAVAARLMSAFTLARYYTSGRRSAIRALMSVLTQSHTISKQVAEIARATLKGL